jgi:hypothetical protein
LALLIALPVILSLVALMTIFNFKTELFYSNLSLVNKINDINTNQELKNQSIKNEINQLKQKV